MRRAACDRSGGALDVLDLRAVRHLAGWLLAGLAVTGCATTPTAPERAAPVPTERRLAFQARGAASGIKKWAQGKARRFVKGG
jgi:hypothetical protein